MGWISTESCKSEQLPAFGREGPAQLVAKSFVLFFPQKVSVTLRLCFEGKF